MAEYYPLLAKAVAGLPNSTPETRHAIYARARKALIGQLQNSQPPLLEADIAHETEALDAAVARLEAELAASNSGAAAAPRPDADVQGIAKKAPPEMGDTKTWPARRVPPAAPRPNGAEPGRDRGGASATRDRGPQTDESGERDDHTYAADFSEPPQMRSDILRPEPVRPYAPQPENEDAPQSRRLWIVVAVVVIVVGMVAVAAWKLRDRPEDLGAFKAAQQSQAEQSSRKIAARIGGAAPESAPNAAAPAANPGKAAAPMQTQTAPPQPAQPQAAATATPASTATPNAAQKTADSSTNLPIAYRAALLVESPDEANKVKTYVGTVIWKLESVSNDSGQPPSTAVRADIDVPSDKLKASLEIQKNSDASLSASHTITIVFTIAPDSPTGGIKQISVPQLRNEDSPNGAPLSGSMVPIMADSFLIGLNGGNAETTNIDLIKQREWFDIPILLANGRVAKLTFEKNASGDRAIADALASWQARQ